MTDRYTLEDVKNAAQTAIRIMGKDYIYKAPVGLPRAISKCFYSDSEALAAAGGDLVSLKPRDNEVNNGSASCIVGFVSRILDFPLTRSGSASSAVSTQYVTGEAKEFLCLLQYNQDQGVPWGRSYEKACTSLYT